MTRRRATCCKKRAEASRERRTKRTRQARACVSRTSSSTCAISRPPTSWRPPCSRRSGRLETTTGASPLATALGLAALGLGRRSEARQVFAESLDLVLAADKKPESGLTDVAHRHRARSRHGRRAIGGAGSKAQSTSWTSPLPQPAIPSAQAIPRAAAHRRPRRGRIRERAGTRRRHDRRAIDLAQRSSTQRAEEQSPNREGPRRSGLWVRDFPSLSRSKPTPRKRGYKRRWPWGFAQR